ncbi:MAG: DapH/DapD/GlmU-related protein [Porphyromonas sp.]|nr:DapH/DapD/GlmU-related protein [Porphyromonas sp.]
MVHIHPSSLVERGCKVGRGTYIWHFCHLMRGAQVGRNCSLGQNVVMMPHAVLADGCRVQNNVTLYTGVQCEEEVFLGPSCVFTNVLNPRAFINRKAEYNPTLLKRGCSIGANATILCGTVIGRYALVGAGAVVIRDVPDFGLVVGNPSRQIGWVSRAAHRLEFNEEGLAACPQTGEYYRLENGAVYLLEEDEDTEPLDN